jgi:hypothetical protein
MVLAAPRNNSSRTASSVTMDTAVVRVMPHAVDNPTPYFISSSLLLSPERHRSSND